MMIFYCVNNKLYNIFFLYKSRKIAHEYITQKLPIVIFNKSNLDQGKRRFWNYRKLYINVIY
jgi:hypothetical protein